MFSFIIHHTLHRIEVCSNSTKKWSKFIKFFNNRLRLFKGYSSNTAITVFFEFLKYYFEFWNAVFCIVWSSFLRVEWHHQIKIWLCIYIIKELFMIFFLMLPVWKLFRIFSFSLRQIVYIFRLFHMKKLKIFFFTKTCFSWITF